MGRWNSESKWAVITGASSGIGQSLATKLVAEGCHVVAVARRQERLRELAAAAERNGHRGQWISLAGDITDGETRQAIARVIADNADDRLDLLVNNAGIGAIGPFAEATESRMRQIMEVNFFAPVELTRLLLPALARSEDAVICNVGSVLGHRAVPDKSEYCASKFALHGWTDSVRAELADTSISVTLVSPSTTSSEFFESLVETDSNVRSKSIGSWPPEKVADATLDAIRRRRAEVILSAGGKALVYADRLCPPLMNVALRKRAD